MIANHAHADGSGSYPSIQTLARETRMSERGVQYCIAALKESGELVVEADGGPHGCNLYTIPMTQSLRQSKSGMTQNPVLMTQNLAPHDAIAIAPESKNRPLEPSYHVNNILDAIEESERTGRPADDILREMRTGTYLRGVASSAEVGR